MSDTTDRPGRRGSALLPVLIISIVLAVCALSLWRSASSARLASEGDGAMLESGAMAESVLARSAAAAEAGAWRTLPLPGDTSTVTAQFGRTTRRHATLTRLGWSMILARATASLAGGRPGVTARADRRILIPLSAALEVPVAAVTGAEPWVIQPGALVEVPTATPAEARCRENIAPVAQLARSWRVDTSLRRTPAFDADSVRDTIRGLARLGGPRLSTPIAVSGMLVLDSDLTLEADLHVSGVLVVNGSVVPAGGRLDVTGAIVTADIGGRHSELGAGGRVRYDACAIRRAIDLSSTLASPARWQRVSAW